MKNLLTSVSLILLSIIAVAQQPGLSLRESNLSNATSRDVNTTILPPYNLEAQVAGSIVTLNWDHTDADDSLFYCNDVDTMFNSMGTTDGLYYFEFGMYWPSEELAAYDGGEITSFSFIPVHGDTINYELNIYVGDSGNQLIYTQPLTYGNIVDEWVEIRLHQSIMLDVTQDLYIVVGLYEPFESFPASIDAGPEANNYGNVVRSENPNAFPYYEWIPIAQYGFPYNFLMKAHLEIPMPDMSRNITSGYDGFNVYRDNVLLTNEIILTTTYEDTVSGFGDYTYGVTTVKDGEESIPATILVSVDPLHLGGTVFADVFQIDKGVAYTYMLEADNLVETESFFMDTLGYFSFYPYLSAEYIIKAETTPNSVYDQYLPTYYGGELHWEDASRITLTDNIYNADIQLIEADLNNGTGNGVLSGNIFKIVDGSDDPVPAMDIQILIKDIASNEAGMVVSDQDGAFAFNNLENGTYQLIAEIPGIKTDLIQFDIAESQLEVDDITLVITEERVILSSDDELPAIFNSVSGIFPNPSHNNVNIYVETLKPAVLKLSIIDYLGRSVMGKDVSVDQNKQIISMDISHLQQGYYQLLISGEGNNSVSRKFIKLK